MCVGGPVFWSSGSKNTVTQDKCWSNIEARLKTFPFAFILTLNYANILSSATIYQYNQHNFDFEYAESFWLTVMAGMLSLTIYFAPLNNIQSTICNVILAIAEKTHYLSCSAGELTEEESPPSWQVHTPP